MNHVKPDPIKIHLTREIPFHSRIAFFRWEIVRTSDIHFALRHFQALTAREALEVYVWVCGEANQHELVYPHYREIQETLEHYLLACYAKSWMTFPLPIKRHPNWKASATVKETP